MDSKLQQELSAFDESAINSIPVDNDSIDDNNNELSPERIGRFTGSSNAKLMSCKSRAKGKSWDKVNWITDLGDTALRYITEKAIERIIGEQAEAIDNKYTRWGKAYEDEGKAFFQNKFNVELQDVGFQKYLTNAGATPDALIENGQFTGFVFELKCPETPWSSYKLGLFGIDESHDYFWQLQSEMLSAKTYKFVFCYYDPRFPDDIKIKYHVGSLSAIHVNAMKARIIIGERLIVRLIETNLSCNIWEELPNAISDIPTDYADFLTWLSEAEKPYLL